MWVHSMGVNTHVKFEDPESFIFGHMAKNVLEASTSIRQASFMISIGQHIFIFYLIILTSNKHLKC